MMDHEIKADFNTLYLQAQDVADELMRRAVNSIDDKLGDGYAKKHPELVAAFMNVAGRDLAVSSSLGVMQTLLTNLVDKAIDFTLMNR